MPGRSRSTAAARGDAAAAAPLPAQHGAGGTGRLPPGGTAGGWTRLLVRGGLALLLAGTIGAGAWFLIARSLGPDRAAPAEVVDERFATELRPSVPAFARHAQKLRLDLAVAFDAGFLAAPQSLHALAAPDLSSDAGSETALGPPVIELLVSFPPSEPVPLPRPKPFMPDDRVLNDAQIASLKQRLRLTRGQEPLWQPVERELQDLAWRRTGGDQAPSLDPAAVQRLQMAAQRLLQALGAEQRREVRQLMSVLGL